MGKSSAGPTLAGKNIAAGIHGRECIEFPTRSRPTGRTPARIVVRMADRTRGLNNITTPARAALIDPPPSTASAVVEVSTAEAAAAAETDFEWFYRNYNKR